MSRIDIEIPEPQYACRDVREAWPRLRRVSLRTASARPAMIVSVHRGPFPVFAIDGHFHAAVTQGETPAGSIAGDLARHVSSLAHFGVGSWSFDRLSSMNENLVVVDGVVSERIYEPVWTASVANSHRNDRPAQIRCDLSIYRQFPFDQAPSDAPSVAFRADRKDDLDAFVARMRERHPYSTVFPARGRCQVLAPETLAADDFGLSVGAISRALVGSTHKALPLLPRAAVEIWTGMRRLAAGGAAPAEFARAADSLSPILRLPPLAADPEAEKWRRRAQVQADMLGVRLELEPQLAPDADDILAHQGPAP